MTTKNNAMACFLVIVAGCSFSALAAQNAPKVQAPKKSASANIESGYLTADDGVRLFYSKVGGGPQIVIIPARFYLLTDFQRLAAGRTLIFYDMRDRGASDAVTDPHKLTIEDDVKDLDSVRRHFHADKPDLIGWSYLGMMVILYATEHPDNTGRIVQLGPLSRKPGATFPKALTAGDEDRVPDPAEDKKLNELYRNGYAREHPKEYCEMDWKIQAQRLVGNPANAARIPSPCDLPREWPINLYAHFGASMASIQFLKISDESLAKVIMPVLTIHGTKDRNAPYGGGREWDLILPNARLVTVLGAAHMSWVDAPEIVFSSIDTFLAGKWPESAKRVAHLE